MDEFIVARRLSDGHIEYVEAISTYDGDTDWTSNPQHARIFRGTEWTEVWSQPGNTLIPISQGDE